MMVFYSVFIVYYLLTFLASLLLILGVRKVSEIHRALTIFFNIFLNCSANTLKWFSSWFLWLLASSFNSSNYWLPVGWFFWARSSSHAWALIGSSASTRCTLKSRTRSWANLTLNKRSQRYLWSPRNFAWNEMFYQLLLSVFELKEFVSNFFIY